jgi:hypothetical protein
VTVRNSAFRIIKISIRLCFDHQTYRSSFSVIDAIFRTMLVDDKLRPVQRGN